MRIRHSHKCSFREGDIEQSCGGSESRTEAYFFYNQEWRDCPEQIEKQNTQKNFVEFDTELLVIETYCGKQVEAQWDTNCRRHNDDYRHQWRPDVEDLNSIHGAPMKQCLNVKNEIHDLRKRKQGANQASVDDQFRPNIGGSGHCRSGW